jgi:hypothetical protein
MITENPKMFFVTVGLVVSIVLLGSFYMLLSTSNGKEVLNNVVNKIPDQETKKEDVAHITFDEAGKPSVITKSEAIQNLTIHSKKTLNETLYTIQMTTLKLTKSNSFHEINIDNKDDMFIDKSKKNNYIAEVLQKNVAELTKIVKMSTNTDKVIRVGVENVSKYDLLYKNIDFKREFFLAKLDELKSSLNNMFLQKIKKEEAKNIYAQLTMIKSISHYLDYEPQKAYNNYELAKKANPSLKVIKELTKEYQDIAPDNLEEMKFAYVLVASAPRSESNMKKTADRLLSLQKANAFREKNYNLYLSINSSKIRVYTIVEYHSKKELDKKIAEIESIEKTALVYDTSKKTPEEYILRETRKKIYVYRTSDRENDKYLVETLKKKNYKQIEAHGDWGKQFDIYAVYYDGNSCDDGDLEKLLDDTRDAINSHAVSAFAYQQSNSDKVKELFQDQQLKYIIVLEKNAYVKKQ